MSPSQILIFDQARSGSHMLVRMLTHKNSDVKLLDHPCGAARGPQMEWLQSEDYAEGMKPEIQEDFDMKIGTGVKQWEERLEEVTKENNPLMIHEHLFTTTKLDQLLILNNLALSKSPLPPTTENFTELPTSLLLHPSTVPVFTIRNPQQAAPSAYRVLARMGFPNGGGRNNFLLVTNLIHTRALYDFYASHKTTPIIVDFESHADPAFMPALAAKLGLDPERLALEWEPTTQEIKHPMWYASQSSLIESGGFLREKLAENLGEGVEKWREEFGEEGADMVREMIELCGVHYEWLFERRFRG